MSPLGTYLGSGVMVRYDFGTTGKKVCYAVEIIFFPSRCENTIYYYMLYIYIISFVFIVSVHK